MKFKQTRDFDNLILFKEVTLFTVYLQNNVRLIS